MVSRESSSISDDNRLPLWLDIIAVLWIIIVTLSFIVKVLVEARVLADTAMFVVVIGHYTYAILIVGCAVAAGLVLVKKFTGNH